MSYTKHTWVNGEIVTAAKMNNIETGIEEASSGGGAFVVTDTGGTLDKTWQEIHDAMMNGIVYVLNEQPFSCMAIVTGIIENGNSNEYIVFVGYEGNAYSTNTKTGYPKAL